MKIEDYPYGKPSGNLIKVIGWLNENAKNVGIDYDYEFGFPDYFGMPFEILEGLTSDDVNWLQEEIFKEFD